MSSWDFLPPGHEPEADADTSTAAGLLELLDAQAALLVDIATGGSRIDDVNARYKRRRRLLDGALRTRAVPTPFPFEDLWAWRGYWQAQELSTYQSRRQRVAELSRPAREALEALEAGAQVSDPGAGGSPTWAELDQRVAGIVAELARAQSRDDLQDVGRRCREVLIAAAKLLADPALLPTGAEAPKAADAKAWLDLFLAAHAAGRTHRELRAFVPVAWDLAQKVTHGDIERVDAYAAAQATVLVVRVLQQLAP
ncbi:hypothetical protein [Modestobacter sp. SYSU DS0290]